MNARQPTPGQDVVVIGSGVGGLVAAILIRAAGVPVRVLESAATWGGKAGVAHVDGVEFDTGPSVLTLPHVFDEVFRAAGTTLAEQITLTRPEPAFRYHFPTGATLDVAHELDVTLASIERQWGPRARDEFRAYLADAARIWEAAAPHFVEGPAPDWRSILWGGVSRTLALGRIDAMTTMQRAIERRVKTPELVMLLERYATYNGSDVRTAPGTLGCIAHVELGLGGYGVQGGLFRLVEALGRTALRLGVEFEFGCRVERIEAARRGRVEAVVLSGGRRIAASAVVANADARQVFESLLPASKGATERPMASMSAYTAVHRARRLAAGSRPAHTVVFPRDYLAEFSDIFSESRPPRDPTLYLCAQESAHGRSGWDEEEPLFVMANAPAVAPETSSRSILELEARVEERLRELELIGPADRRVWRRTPQELAARFPGSDGALYGAASNDKWSAFRRPANENKQFPGLFLASGSAHPGGGLPLVAQSGKRAAQGVLRYRGVSV